MSKEFYSAHKWNMVVHYVFKIVPMLISGMCIYLGYKLFVLGVTGEASLIINANSLAGQLTNAAPGLFFAVGGIASLICSILKGVTVHLPQVEE